MAIPQDNKYKKFKRHTFSNDEAGFELCEALIDKFGHHIILEATGTYSMKFTYWFCERGYPEASGSVINPKSSKYFNLLQGHGNKTDDVDAIALSPEASGWTFDAALCIQTSKHYHTENQATTNYY